MNPTASEHLFKILVEALEIPPSAYEKARDRYKDLGAYMDDPKSACSKHSPHIYAQGSFRMGTVIRPLLVEEGYDLDLGCRLRVGIAKATHTQKNLKDLVGGDLEAYRQARRIEEALEEMHRCWRLIYADGMSFHMDVVPSIPQESGEIKLLKEAMVKYGSAADLLAERVASHAGAITDDRHPNYRVIAPNWRVSNSEGYALWFESRIKLAQEFLQKYAMEAKVAQVDDLPTWKWRSPLQQAVQLLKRHRDVMYKDNSDSKPISIILTTLAALAYQGELTLAGAVRRILEDMEKYIRPQRPRVPNPVNPAEDFADKWHDPEYAHFQLEHNFRVWLAQARADFELLEKAGEPEKIIQQLQRKFEITVGLDAIRKALGAGGLNIISEPRTHVITETPPKPWLRF